MLRCCSPPAEWFIAFLVVATWEWESLPSTYNGKAPMTGDGDYTTHFSYDLGMVSMDDDLAIYHIMG